MPGNCFYHHLCQWCGLKGNGELLLKKCSDCHLVSYCCLGHQKYDWIIHKKFCKSVKYMKEKCCKSLFTFKGKSQEEWNSFRINFMFSVEVLLKRKLEVYERQMILFPNVCNLCYKNIQSSHPCRECYCIFYCSKEHFNADSVNHNKNCKELKLCLDLDLYLKDQPLNCVENFIPRNERKDQFPSNIEEYFADSFVGSCRELEEILRSERLSFVLSLLYGLFKSESIDLISLTRVTIHVIGSSEHEENMVKFMEILFDWLPQLKIINVFMIGPECNDCPLNISLNNKFEGRNQLIINRVKKLYHEYANDYYFEVPNIVVAFNCGFSEYTDGALDTWKETIHCLLNFRKVLLITTSYTKLEAENDFSRIIDSNIQNSELEIIVCAKKNPYRSLRPLRDWENLSVFYLNNYITVLFVQQNYFP